MKDLARILAAAEAADAKASGAALYISGYEWGPGVNKVIFSLPEEVESVSAEGALVSTAGVPRTVTGAFLSDAAGEGREGASPFVTLTLQTDSRANGSPFVYDHEVTFMNQWAKTYPLAASFAAGGKTWGYKGECIKSRLCPSAGVFARRGEHTGIYENPMTGEAESITLRWAAYEPSALMEDGQKNPLIIWLHGQGEGGKDPDIVLLGNKVTALASDLIQSHFTTEGGAGGAYVLVCQAETYWMDGGDGTNSHGDIPSRYTGVLMDTIRQYVAENPDVDEKRIYLGGCSNGGFMTVNMLVEYPDYFAAAYPNCEAYAFYEFDSIQGNASAMGGANEYHPSTRRWMTKEKIEAIKDIPIWFVQSADDSVVVPSAFVLPTYGALLQAGAKNAWLSLFESIQGKDDPAAAYPGHWVWCWLFNDAVTACQDPKALTGEKDPFFGFTPSNKGGGSTAPQAEGKAYPNLFAWLNAQKKA